MTIVKAFSLALAACGILACVTREPVRDIVDQPVSSRTPLTAVQVEEAIFRGGRKRGWRMEVIEPGHIEATLRLRTHVAVVDILHDDRKYTIQYRDSESLNYDGTNIHGNYNRWVANLDLDIQRSLP